MKKQMIKGIAVLTAVLCLGTGTVRADTPQPEAWEDGIEQVYVNMPELYVYGNFSDGWQEAQGYLNNEQLKAAEIPENLKNQGTYYYVLLDISGSVTNAYFSGIKEGIRSFSRSMDAGDRMILYTFGEQVQKVLSGGETPEEVDACLDSLVNKDQETLLFEAIDQAAREADSVRQDECMRKVLIVVTDGEDVAAGKKTAEEALDNLKEKNLPLYALGIKDTNSANITSLGEFARRTGGRIEVFGSEQGETAFMELKAGLENIRCLGFQAASNLADNQIKTFSLHLGQDGGKLNYETYIGRWIPDREAPVLTLTQKSEKELLASFSEPVDGAELPANYKLSYQRIKWPEGRNPLDVFNGMKNSLEGTYEEVLVPVIGVVKDNQAANTYLLTVAEPFYSGDYTLVCTEICDRSMEKNALTGTIDLQIQGVPQPLPGDTKPAWMEKLWIWALIAGVAGCLVILFLVYRKLKKGRGVVYLDGKVVLASSVDVKQHVAVQSAETRIIDCTVSVQGKNPQNLKIPVDKSIIAGRSSICDVFFDDPQMSRQHYALEWSNGSLYVTDLHSTNGTRVNGEKIQERTLLHPGDRITAGMITLTVRW
ncbi:MAG: FHA domain-containing protein [Enterocloster sp.]